MDSAQKSNVVIAKILNITMEHGTSHWQLSFNDLDLDSTYETHFYPCAEWLESEGLIRVSGYNRTLGGLATGSIANIALTSLGMAVLGKTVSINGEEETISERVATVSESKVDFHRIGDAIGGLIGGAIKSLAG